MNGAASSSGAPRAKQRAANPGRRGSNESARSGALELLGVVVVRALALAVLWQTGFRAISDDDFARVVIAQDFARAPSWDPSQTSWLPLPFWLWGGVMRVLGTSLDVARVTAWVLAVFVAPLVWVAGRAAGLDRRAALLAAAVGAILPSALWMSLATVPEGLAATLSLLALCTARPRERSTETSHDSATQSAVRRAAKLAALSLACTAAACACRYECWALAAALCGLGVVRGVRARSFASVATSLGYLAFPLIWSIYGALHHGSPTFYLKRVASYRAALGQSPSAWWEIVTNYPYKLVSHEPELCAAVLVLFLGLLRRGSVPVPRGLRTAWLGAAALLAFLVLGDARDGAPTHHPERALLTAWLVLTLTAAHFWQTLRPPRGAWLAAATAACVLGLGYRLGLGPRFEPAQREDEVFVGRALQAVLGTERVLIDTGDYGYLAVVAALDRPGQSVVFNAQDPRLPKRDVWRSDATLREALREARANWVVTRLEHAPRLAALSDPNPTALNDPRRETGQNRRGSLVWARVAP